ncbi:MAG: alpha/beta fold hydrolase [Deltaproteobacteria bacterium]|nr:alpha/beta fold hydrolase [Deltaproteobacteria bacterium]MCL5278264.1 alpha/beta fold hydrolase [Deltaproteobacteria bacterium]
MIVFKVLARFFIVVLVYVAAQFAIAVYDRLNFQHKPMGSGLSIAREVLYEAVVTSFAFLTYIIGFVNYDGVFLRRHGKRYPPVLLVHGYMMNRACYIYMHIRLALDGFRVFTVNLYPPLRSIAELSECVADKVDEVDARTGEKEVYLIGHSMGGLVARYYGTSQRGRGRVKGLITIASPHRGTRIAALGIGKNAKEMVPGSAFLSGLDAKPLPRIYSIWSTLDNLVVPPEHAYSEGIPNLSVPFQGHIAMLFSNTVYGHTVRLLKGDGPDF